MSLKQRQKIQRQGQKSPLQTWISCSTILSSAQLLVFQEDGIQF